MAYKTLNMDFNSTIAEDISAFDDFAWVQTADKNLFVVASATDFKLALVDMSQSDPTVEYITLSDKTFGPDDRIRDRQIEWVQGSNYVWVSGRTEAQVYVVDIVKKEVVKTFTDVEANKLVSVKSRQYENIADMVNQVFDENGVWEARVPEQQEAPVQAAPARPISDPSSSSEDVANSAVSSANSALSDSESSGSSNGLSIVALAISCVAIVAVVTNFYMSQQKQASDDTIAGKKSQVPPSVA